MREWIFACPKPHGSMKEAGSTKSVRVLCRHLTLPPPQICSKSHLLRLRQTTETQSDQPVLAKCASLHPTGIPTTAHTQQQTRAPANLARFSSCHISEAGLVEGLIIYFFPQNLSHCAGCIPSICPCCVKSAAPARGPDRVPWDGAKKRVDAEDGPTALQKPSLVLL